MYALLFLLFCIAVLLILYLRLPWIRTETVRYQSGDVTLVGTLALPRWRNGPYPAAVVVQGSAPLSRWVYWSYVRQLAPHGMAVLIYDKRGVGASSGIPAQSPVWTLEGIRNCGVMFEILAKDSLAGIRLLRSRPEIDPRRVGFIGISQAGWIMPLAASKSADVAFVVSISGPAVSCGIEDRFSQLTGEYRSIPEYGGPAPYAEGELSDEDIDGRLDDYQGPEGYNPLPVLGSLRVPMLWLLGAHDRSVPTSRSVANIKRLIAAGAPFDFKVYPEGDHVLVRGAASSSPVETGFKRLFDRIDYWPDIRAWLAERNLLPPSATPPADQETSSVPATHPGFENPQGTCPDGPGGLPSSWRNSTASWAFTAPLQFRSAGFQAGPALGRPSC